MVNVNLIVRDTSRLLVDFCYTQLIFFIFKSHTEIHPKTYAFAQHLQTVGMKSMGPWDGSTLSEWLRFSRNPNNISRSAFIQHLIKMSLMMMMMPEMMTLAIMTDEVETVDDQSDVVAGSDHWWSSGLAFKTAWTGFPNNVIVPQIHKHTNTKIHNQTNTQTHNYTKHTNTFDHWCS